MKIVYVLNIQYKGVVWMTNESIWDKVDSIEKRFENRLDKSNLKFNTLNPVWDNEKETALNVAGNFISLMKIGN